jgi:hypothetical protein
MVQLQRDAVATELLGGSFNSPNTCSGSESSSANSASFLSISKSW